MFGRYVGSITEIEPSRYAAVDSLGELLAKIFQPSDELIIYIKVKPGIEKVLLGCLMEVRRPSTLPPSPPRNLPWRVLSIGPARSDIMRYSLQFVKFMGPVLPFPRVKETHNIATVEQLFFNDFHTCYSYKPSFQRSKKAFISRGLEGGELLVVS